jgi:carboxypeptidase Taq
MKEELDELKKRFATVSDLRRAAAVLSWDQQTYMPPRGASARAEQLATLEKLAHEHFVADENGALLNDLAADAAQLPYDSDDATMIRVMKRDYDKAKRVPPALVEEMARAGSLAFEAWHQARAESNFRLFQPHLEKNIELRIQLANYLGYQDRIYDALLDQFEPEMTSAQVETIFTPLKKEIIALTQPVARKSNAVDDAVLHREYDEQKQWDFGLELVRRIGFDFARGRQDKAPHPFTIGFALNDVRITTRVSKNFLSMMLFGTIHESGHALYDMGYRAELERTPLGGAASLGVHESQSRLWENVVGRSRGFWQYWFPRLREVFPTRLADQTVESFYRAINKVEPSFIRGEADEVTYSLHVMLRFEIENPLVERRLKVADVPEAWNAKMKEYLGIGPPNDAQGCLQDVHWSYGDLGYFATYSLGSMFAVQLYEKAVRDLPAIPEQIARGEFAELLGWLRKNVHTHGRKFTLDELARRVTGEPLQSRSYVAYLKKSLGKFTECEFVGATGRSPLLVI